MTSAEGKEKRSTGFLLYALISKNSTSGHFCYTNFCEIANFYHVENVTMLCVKYDEGVMKPVQFSWGKLELVIILV